MNVPICTQGMQRTWWPEAGTIIVTGPYYVNPVWCVAIVCHQVGCMHWGHLGHLHRAISHLKWYKLLVWDILPVHFVRWNILTCFPCICNLEFPDIFFGDLLRFEHRTSLFSCLCMSMLTPNSSGNMQKHGYLGCFHAASSRENISGGRLNKKDGLTRYGDSHVKDTTS